MTDDIIFDVEYEPRKLSAYKTTVAQLARNKFIWQGGATCFGADVEIFYPHRKSYQAAAIDKYCVECPFRLQCLFYALLLHDEHGIWGGATEVEKKSLLNKIDASQYSDYRNGYDMSAEKFLSAVAEDFLFGKFGQLNADETTPQETQTHTSSTI